MRTSTKIEGDAIVTRSSNFAYTGFCGRCALSLPEISQLDIPYTQFAFQDEDRLLAYNHLNGSLLVSEIRGNNAAIYGSFLPGNETTPRDFYSRAKFAPVSPPESFIPTFQKYAVRFLQDYERAIEDEKLPKSAIPTFFQTFNHGLFLGLTGYKHDDAVKIALAFTKESGRA